MSIDFSEQKFAWLTDIHLNFLAPAKRVEFYKEINACNATHVLITGDIAEATSLEMILMEMDSHIANKFIYFVLGNHDYYDGTISEVSAMLSNLDLRNTHWLTLDSPLITANAITLIGSDSWADGRHGDYANSQVVLNDSQVIYDLHLSCKAGKDGLLCKMQELADTAAKWLGDALYSAAAYAKPAHDHDVFIVLTHIPPFEEVCLYGGKRSNKDYLPFYSCKATGDVLLAFAKEYPTINIIVLCGHTHSAAEYQPLPNLLVKCGKSEYYRPKIQEILEFGKNNEYTRKAKVSQTEV